MIDHQQTLAFLQNIGWPEMVVIALVALLIFGGRLPEVGKSLGRSIIEFKKGLKETGDDIKQSLPEKPDLSATADQTSKKDRQHEDGGSFNAP
jgi:sec-independent protein translocase protein TatA